MMKSSVYGLLTALVLALASPVNAGEEKAKSEEASQPEEKKEEAPKKVEKKKPAKKDAKKMDDHAATGGDSEK